MTMVRIVPSLSERSLPRLMAKLRRIGGLVALFILLVFASLHWISQDMNAAVRRPGLSKRAIVAALEENVGRLSLVIVIAGIALAAVFLVSAVLVTRFVRHHFRELESMNKRKSQFVSMVSHELRTPLNAIAGFSDLLANGAFGALNEGQADCVKEVRSGSTHLKRMINDILDISKIEAGSIDLNKAELKVGAALAGALVVAGPLARARGVELATRGDADADVDADATVLGDPVRLKQVLLNLISNAIKHSPAGRKVEVTASRRDGEVRITVADQGEGIARADQEKLFEEFRQLRSAAEATEGTGLGLAICRKLVELQGGRIWVESSPGAGARFHFTLPSGMGG
jgi:signal transduction histidine kinase